MIARMSDINDIIIYKYNDNKFKLPQFIYFSVAFLFHVCVPCSVYLHFGGGGFVYLEAHYLIIHMILPSCGAENVWHGGNEGKVSLGTFISL